MEIINIAKGIVMQIEVIFIVEYIILAIGSRYCGVIDICALDVGHPRVEFVVAFGGEEEVVGGVGMELQILVVCHKRMQQEACAEQRDYQQSQIYAFVEIDMLELLLLSEGRTVDFACVFDLFLNVDLAIGILNVQYGEKPLRFG